MLLLLARPDVQRTQEARVLGTGARCSRAARARLGRAASQRPTEAAKAAAGVLGDGGVVRAVRRERFRRPLAGGTGGVADGRAHLRDRPPPFRRRAAAFAAAALFGSLLFIRYGSMAETDIWVALFNTLAIGAMWRCFDDDIAAQPAASSSSASEQRRRFLIWAHVSAVGIGLVILVKGAPAVFPLIFLIGIAAVRRRWDVPLRRPLSGAPITAIVIGADGSSTSRRSPRRRSCFASCACWRRGAGTRDGSSFTLATCSSAPRRGRA